MQEAKRPVAFILDVGLYCESKVWLDGSGGGSRGRRQVHVVARWWKERQGVINGRLCDERR